MKTSQISRTLLLTGSLAAAVIGQFYFARKPDYPWDAVVFYGVGIILFLAALRPATAQGPSASQAAHSFDRRRLWRAVPVIAALALGLVVAFRSAEAQANYWPLFWTWLMAAMLYLLAFLPWPSFRSFRSFRSLRSLRPEPGGPAGGEQQAAGEASAAVSPADELSAPGATSRSWPADWRRLWARSWEWCGVALLVLGAWAVRAWHVASIPWTLGGDEGSQGLWARRMLAGDIPNIFGLGWLSVPNLSFAWQAAWLRLVGDSVLGLRLPWTVVGALTVLGAYLLVRSLFDRWLALLAAFLLATYHFHIHYSRLGSNQIADPLFVVWSLYFLALGLQTGPDERPGRRRWAWVVSGMIAGGSFYAYAGARQAPLILLVVLIWAALSPYNLGHDRGRRVTGFLNAHGGDLLAMFGGFLILCGPMAMQAFRFPDDFNARLNQVGILQSGWLDRAVEATGRTRLSLLAEQVRKAFLAFNFYTDRVAWYGPNIPLLDFAASIFFVLGAAFSVSRLAPPVDTPAFPDEAGHGGSPWAGWRYAVFVVWFLVTVTFGSALTENPPSSQRLVSSAVPVVFFVAVALVALSRALGDAFGWTRQDRRVLSGGLALALAVISLRFYFGPYQASWVYGSANAEVATSVGYYLRAAGQGGPPGQNVPRVAYFLGAPRMYVEFGSIPFLARDVQLHDVTGPLTAPPNFVDPGLRPVFIFLPERAGELAWVQQAYPGGTVQEVHRVNDPHGPLLFVAYQVP